MRSTTRTRTRLPAALVGAALAVSALAPAAAAATQPAQPPDQTQAQTETQTSQSQAEPDQTTAAEAPVEDPFAVGGPVGDIKGLGVTTTALPVPKPPVALRTAPEGAARYVGQSTCDPVVRPGTAALRSMMFATYGSGRDGGITRTCSIGGTSEHKEGRAFDWMLNSYNSQERAVAESYLQWLVGPDADGVEAGNARRLGVMYVIWNRRMWSTYKPYWRTYTGSNPHTDHIHTSLTWDGAMKRTSWYTGTAISGNDYGPCQRVVNQPVPPYTRRNPAPCPEPQEPLAFDVTRSVPLSGDWDGDGRAEVGWFTDGAFRLETADGKTTAFGLGGRRGDVPVVGDWDDDGDDEVGVFRAGTWFLRDTLGDGGPDRVFKYGRNGDRPVVGTWVAGGRDGVGLVRRNAWLLRTEPAAGRVESVSRLGRSSDIPVVGDWDGNGVSGPGVRRGSRWYLARDAKSMAVTRVYDYGNAAAMPLTGDWDGNGSETPGVTSGTTFLLTNQHGPGATRVTEYRG